MAYGREEGGWLSLLNNGERYDDNKSAGADPRGMERGGLSCEHLPGNTEHD